MKIVERMYRRLDSLRKDLISSSLAVMRRLTMSTADWTVCGTFSEELFMSHCDALKR
jgi:hypothetical protein